VEPAKNFKVEPQRSAKVERAHEETTGEEQNSERTDDEVYHQRHERAAQKEKNIIVKIEL
jgi:hypothetical protein